MLCGFYARRAIVIPVIAAGIAWRQPRFAHGPDTMKAWCLTTMSEWIRDDHSCSARPRGTP
jgi:hypothetical protein